MICKTSDQNYLWEYIMYYIRPTICPPIPLFRSLSPTKVVPSFNYDRLPSYLKLLIYTSLVQI